MPKVDPLHTEIQLDEARQDAVLIVSKDGDIMMVEPPFKGEQPDHVRMVEGICKALSSPVLFQEMLELAERGNAIGANIPTTKAPLPH